MEHELREIQECLIEQFKEHMETASTKELYEVMDMIKDVSETLYYHTITESMHKEEMSKVKSVMNEVGM